MKLICLWIYKNFSKGAGAEQEINLAVTSSSVPKLDDCVVVPKGVPPRKRGKAETAV